VTQWLLTAKRAVSWVSGPKASAAGGGGERGGGDDYSRTYLRGGRRQVTVSGLAKDSAWRKDYLRRESSG